MHSPAPLPSVVYATLTVENSDTIQIVQNAPRARLDDMGVFFRENQFSYEPQGASDVPSTELLQGDEMTERTQSCRSRSLCRTKPPLLSQALRRPKPIPAVVDETNPISVPRSQSAEQSQIRH
jgi:hypothetical protein